MAFRNIAQRTPEAHISTFSRILWKMNDISPLKNTQDLIHDTLHLYSVYNERLRTLFNWLAGSIDREGATELVKRLRKTLFANIDQVILDFKGVSACSSEAKGLLLRKGLLQTEGGRPWMAANASACDH